jgi:catechol 2,3-dioxygenase-like lactoylglutathione lyase family enzyme
MAGPHSNAHTVTKLPAQDLDRARAFYREKLGLELIEQRTGGLRYVYGRPSSISSARRARHRGNRPRWNLRSRTSKRHWPTCEPGCDLRALRDVWLRCSRRHDRRPDNYRSKGTGELGTFFYDSEGNLIGIAQPVRDRS